MQMVQGATEGTQQRATDNNPWIGERSVEQVVGLASLDSVHDRDRLPDSQHLRENLILRRTDLAGSAKDQVRRVRAEVGALYDRGYTGRIEAL